ncbi:MAG TPA: cytochrome c [Gemmatimonadales bacterium]|nr:cytochrome c [Gemmatimonadales bacterium]
MRKPIVAALALLLLAACDPDYVVHHVGWFATMRHQRSIRPYAMPRGSVPGTVPVTGVEPDSLGPVAAEKLSNPRTRTSESLNRGKWEYETYCLVCHGPTGHGDGPISSASGGPFVGVRSLVTDTVARRSDGYIYGVLVHAPSMGRGLMPIYGDKVHGADRWDLVNYVRSLQLEAGARGRP